MVLVSANNDGFCLFVVDVTNDIMCSWIDLFDVYFEALKKCVEGALGYIVVRGIRDDDDDDNDDEEHSDEEDSTEKYSDEQMNMTRVVLVTKSREKFMEKTDKFATCGQAGSGCMMFNTHSGNVIISGIPKEILKILKNWMRLLSVLMDFLH